MKDNQAPNCERSNDLMALLYGEVTESETLSFTQHMLSCPLCKDEFASFTEIRKPLFAWRQEALGHVASIPLPALELKLRPERSANAALREFFNLSPLWMKGAVGFASLLFCVLAILAVAGLLTPKQIVSQNSGYTDAEVEARVAQRVEQRLAQLKANKSEVVVQTPQELPPRKAPLARPKPVRSPVVATRRPLTKEEKLQLAADLRLNPSDELELDLLSDRLTGQDD